jgi:hypothetical protein
MKATWSISTLFMAVLVAQMLCAAISAAQEDYPIPRGDPALWGIPGHAERLPEEAQTSDPSIFSAPQPRGNEAQSSLAGPAGEAEEKYTGTWVFNGVAGTGLDRYGIPQSR